MTPAYERPGYHIQHIPINGNVNTKNAVSEVKQRHAYIERPQIVAPDSLNQERGLYACFQTGKADVKRTGEQFLERQ
jgi:hypothetical protein